ncbi:C40 family peptidase [Candidatus Planktophila versatilis]|uniref:C40 family peptidase n=1 Tax=Candidatus Planktophila versatilis TaxID=1884905 RepID=UPI000BBFD09D|nr:C40 family peptidase [Candidatus Planktophila versatilis]ASY26505.1 cell wall hydrolase [Candidatus Planktophila versatilis]
MNKPMSAATWGTSVAILLSIIQAPTSQAAQTLAQVQAQVIRYEEEATSAAEGAQEAKVKLNSLTRSLAGIQAQAQIQAKTVDAISKTLGAIAIDQYKSGTISQSLELLFSSDPSLYLSSAGSLEAITRQKGIQLRKFQSAEQQLNATSLTVSDRLAQVKALQKKLAEKSALATAKLAKAESILAKLKKEDRERLARLAQEREDADQASSLKAARSAAGVSGRAGLAIKFAFKQIGDKYVFGADGLTYWDCSGLTMRAYQTAGVSLPHSSAAQSRMGKSIPFSQKKPGDLMFFGRPVSHVGIYLGGGKMVHAPRSGSRVKVATTDMGRKRLVAIRRF